MIQKGKLTQIKERVGKFALFKCDCGNERMMRYSDVSRSDSKATKSCGCLKRKGLSGKYGLQKGDRIQKGRLTQISEREGRYAKFRCECGEEKDIYFYDVMTGHTKSCGCFNIDKLTKHGMHNTPEYRCWSDMKDRCFNKNNPYFKDYGGRGISIFSGWRDSFEMFYKYIGKRPSDEHSLERIDNEKSYQPSNVKWATRSEQVTNRRVCENKTSSFRGVVKYGDNGRWKSNIRLTKEEGGIRIHIGTFESETEAAKAYDAKVIELGIKRHINFPEDYKDQETNILNKIQ